MATNVIGNDCCQSFIVNSVFHIIVGVTIWKKSHTDVESACKMFWSVNIFHPPCSKLHNQTLWEKNRKRNYFLSSLSRSLSSSLASLSSLVSLVSVVFGDCRGLHPLLHILCLLIQTPIIFQTCPSNHCCPEYLLYGLL